MRFGAEQCKCGRRGAMRKCGRVMCKGCWGSAGARIRAGEDDDDELADAIETVAAVGIGVALGGDPVTEIATEVAVRVAAPVVEEVLDAVTDLFDW